MLNNEDVELSACQQLWNFLYVKDCSKQITLLSEWAYVNMETSHEVINLASEDTRTLKSYIEEMYSLTGSSSKLLYGKVVPKNLVSLNPDITKLKNAIGFVADYSFAQGYQNVINKYKNG
jgi:nucleoside-diphosphate-sugar epimerase